MLIGILEKFYLPYKKREIRMKVIHRMTEKNGYLLFCSECGVPQPITKVILQANIDNGDGKIKCCNCDNEILIPDYLKKIAGDL
jgi:hypothetical protein